jgi:hypothetical protein
VRKTALLGTLAVVATLSGGPASAGAPTPHAATAVRHDVTQIRGLTVDRYRWPDARGRPRTVSLVRYGQAGGGGYAIRMTYQTRRPGGWTTNVINAADGPDGGFGYFVSHEAFRTFDIAACPGGSNNCTIASLHGEDDSPLGRYLPGSGRTVVATRSRAVHEFTLVYPHWGTIVPMAEPTGPGTPADLGFHRRYELPVRLRWTFTAGQDFPRFDVRYDLSSAPANTVSADVRAPYGVMIFDRVNGPLTRLEWADSHRFATTGATVSSASGWTWQQANTGARYNLLVAGRHEFGLVDTRPYRLSRLGSGYADARGQTSDTHAGCADVGWKMPCDWQWTYQSVQYENFDATPNASKKLAWGSAPYVGTSKSTDDGGEPFAGHPLMAYSMWITFGRTGGAATRALAASRR